MAAATSELAAEALTAGRSPHGGRTAHRQRQIRSCLVDRPPSQLPMSYENAAGQGLATRGTVRRPALGGFPPPVRHAARVGFLRGGHEAREQKRMRQRLSEYRCRASPTCGGRGLRSKPKQGLATSMHTMQSVR